MTLRDLRKALNPTLKRMAEMLCAVSPAVVFLIGWDIMTVSGNRIVRNDIIGDAYEYLTKTFADATSKKAGEFFNSPDRAGNFSSEDHLTC